MSNAAVLHVQSTADASVFIHVPTYAMLPKVDIKLETNSGASILMKAVPDLGAGVSVFSLQQL